MHQILDRHPKTPEGIILARRAFDKKLKKAALSAKAPEAEATARDAVSRVLRRALNDIVHKADPTANTDKILRSQSMMYRAMENLTESYKTYDTTGGAVLELAKRHPMATAMAVGGTGTLGGLLTPTILGGAVVGAGAYGAYKGLPNALSGVGRGLGALGALSDPARVPILRSAAIYGNMEDELANRRAMDKRIDRMEIKIDKLIDAVTELVRVEVVLQTIETRLNNQSEFLKVLDGRIDAIEIKVPIYDIGIGLLKRSMATILTLILTGVVGSFFIFTN